MTAQQLRQPVAGARAKPARPRGHLGLPTQIALRLLVPVLVVLAWWALSRSTTSGYFVAGPLESLETVGSMFFSGDAGRLFLGEATFDHFVPSVARALAGLGLAIVVGVGVGVVLGVFPVAHALFQPLVHVGRSLPSPALLGVFFLLFGIGDSPKIFLIAFSVVWPILFNTIDGVMSVGEIRSQAAAVYKIPTRLVLTHIVLPGASPKIFAGIRTAMSMSLIIMIISELQKSDNGLGYLLVSTQRDFNYPGFFAVLIVLAVLGIIMNFIFLQIERRVLAWHRGVTAQND